MQTRTFESRIETREDGKGRHLRGYFAVFDGRYNYPWGDYETIARHAFDNTVGDDVRALINHDTTLVLGRTTASTLDLWIDDHGLGGDILINDRDSDAVNMWERCGRGDVSGCSFGFDIVRESFTIEERDVWHWVLEEVRLYEVSPCTFPAYKDTEITAEGRNVRAADDKTISARRYAHWKHDMEEKIKSWH